MPRARCLGFSLSGHNYGMVLLYGIPAMTNQRASATMTGRKELVAVEHHPVDTLGR
jgi:hypothetical protein